MEIYQLKTFLIVAQEGHLTRAAERLHISQPAVSGQIKCIEQELDMSLFERRHGGMQPTPAALSLVPHVERVLDMMRELTWAAGKLKGKLTGRLTLGVILDPDFIQLGALTRRLRISHPYLEIDVRHKNSDMAIPSLRSREIDAGFYLGSRIPGDMSALTLRNLDYWVVGSTSMRESLAGADWKDVVEMPWVSTQKEGSHHQMTRAMFVERGLAPHNVLEADQESTIVNLVRAGVGLGLLRAEVASRAVEAGDVVIWEKGGAQSTLSLIHLKSRQSDAIIAIAVEAIARIWEAGEITNLKLKT